MKKMIKFPSIEQFRNVVVSVSHSAKYLGQDDENNPIFNEEAIMPTLTFTGTVKIHGTNAGISYNKEDGLWAQSRTEIITPEKDNSNFAKFVHENEDSLLTLLKNVAKDINLKDEDTLTMYGEWCGKGIQKGTGINNLEKSLLVFGLKVTPAADIASYWVNVSSPNLLENKEVRVYNIDTFQKYSIDIDFSDPANAQKQLLEYTSIVEKECPVAKSFGFTGIGEGIVWTAFYKDSLLRFKVKGEKHASSKKKNKVSIAPEKLKSITEFVDSVVTENRFNQCISENFSDDLGMKNVGDVLKWMNQDIQKEESDVLEASELTFKDVSSSISKKVVRMLKEHLDNIAFKS